MRACAYVCMCVCVHVYVEHLLAGSHHGGQQRSLAVNFHIRQQGERTEARGLGDGDAEPLAACWVTKLNLGSEEEQGRIAH